ncbi:BnaC04g55890D [Brassica napus]|uniref:BnaC04g55890D protein n=1 Tax=Brassica napus TaxID=3708 RepID=A0A078J6W9_BRANA|nr:BnaCnng28510D [Brassica napus]CDY60487.1 BnaC04g55890D [Brassica napus]
MSGLQTCTLGKTMLRSSVE